MKFSEAMRALEEGKKVRCEGMIEEYIDSKNFHHYSFGTQTMSVKWELYGVPVELKQDPEVNEHIPDKWGEDYWFKFRDSIFEVGKPNFSLVGNKINEHPDPNVIRIADCKYDVFIDISCCGSRKEALERAEALCKVLNADYPFLDNPKQEPEVKDELVWHKFSDENPKLYEWIWTFRKGRDAVNLEKYGYLEDMTYTNSDLLWAEAKIEYPPIPVTNKEGHECIDVFTFQRCYETDHSLFLTLNSILREPWTVKVNFCPICGFKFEEKK